VLLFSDAAKHKQRLLDNFIFAGLDPIKDFSVEVRHNMPINVIVVLECVD
jgi:hypothetical protein